MVNGNNVITYALMVEHFNAYQTIWNGDGGRIYMYQCEIPYDVPRQDVWMSHDGKTDGYASIHVDDAAEDFFATGLGIYLYNRDAEVNLHTAVEMPDKEGVRIENICTVMLTGYPGIYNEIAGRITKAWCESHVFSVGSRGGKISGHCEGNR